MPVRLSHDDLRALRDLYDRGLYVRAWRLAETLGPMKSWPGTAARILAGRLAVNLGAPRLARALHYRAWKEDPQDPEAIYYQARDIVVRRGPLAAWELQEQWGELADASREVRADFFALRAYTFARLRDFDAAETWLARAEALAPQHEWIFVERAVVLELEDRYDEALMAAQRSLKLRPWYRPGVQAAARLLEMAGRDADALELLGEATERTESFVLLAQLAALQRELGQFKAADESLGRATEQVPMAEEDVREWLTCLRADAAYLCGDRERARDLSAACGSEVFQKFAERLADPKPEHRRVHLPVGFVRQHHQTCAPATLAAISRYWGRPAEQLDVAEQICYDGTPQHRLRDWAERNGWAAREFSVTSDDVVALIDRGVPFALTVSRPGQAHLQAVVGFDGLRETWLVRDPGERYLLEASAEGLLKYHRFSGPLGLALVPDTETSRLEGLSLTDQGLYDQVHRLNMALGDHNRPLAHQLYENLLRQAPDHRLTRLARLFLARYDGDATTYLRCVEQLLLLFPDEPQLLLSKLRCLRDLGRRADRMELLEDLLATPDCDAVFRQEYGGELTADARQHAKAVRVLRETLRARPDLAACMSLLANVYWQQRRFEPALALYRFAFCMEDKDEEFAQAFFSASRHLRKSEDAVALLRSRFQRFGRKSSRPARTLFWAYDQLERTREGFDVLDAAIALRPEDGDLLLFTAEMCGAYGWFAEVQRLLDRARPHCRRAAWLRTSAHLARSQGRLKEALHMWQEVLATEPLAADAHAAVARLLAATEGRAAATRHLEETARRFPHSYPLHKLWIEWLRDEDLARAEQAVRHLIEINPADVWAHRELALVLGHQHRMKEALVEADAAIQLSPDNPQSHGIYGHLALQAGNRDEARRALQQALRLSVDLEPAIVDLARMCHTPAERREALAFVHDQLLQQVIFGDGLLAYRAMAEGTLDPEELLASLRFAHQARPDLWQTWLVLVRQLLSMQRRDEALELARAAARRFPLVPRIWYELSCVYDQLGNNGKRILALQKVLKISPDIAGVARELAKVYEEREDLTQSRALIEQALARDPLDHVNHAFLANTLWQQGDREGALARLEQALRLEPGDHWAWDKLAEWGAQAGRPDAARKLARALTEDHGGDPQSWLALARVLDGKEFFDERLGALDRAISLHPRLAPAYEHRALLLVENGRYQEALAACRPDVFDDAVPMELRGRAAWIEANRGNTQAAVDAMRILLGEQPDYLWGWANLLDWLAELKREDEALAAVDQLLRLDPDYAPAYGHRGDIRLARKDRDGARQDFEKALQVAPTYDFAAVRLFGMYLEDNAYDDATRVLTGLKAHDHSPRPIALEMRLNTKRDLPIAAMATLKTLCLTQDEKGGWLRDAVDRAVKAGWRQEVREVLQSCLHDPQACPQVGAEWVRHFIVDLPRARRGPTLARLREEGEIGWAATAAYLDKLAVTSRWTEFFGLVRRHREELRSNLRTWYGVGCGLVHMSANRRAARWFRNWREHPELTPLQLLQVAAPLRRLDRREEAAAVSRHALTVEPTEQHYYHELWLALDDVLIGACDSARQRLSRAAGHLENEPYYRFLYYAVNAVLCVAGRPGDQDGFKAARASLAQAVTAWPKFRQVQTLHRTYRRCVRQIRREYKGPRAWLWALWMRAST